MTENICRLCLQTITDNNCQPVEESLLKFLKLNLNISKENVMCIECASCLRVLILPLSDPENGVKLEPEPIETASNPKSLMEPEIKCSFCTKTCRREALISLQVLKENKLLVNMLEQYIIETNLKSTKEFLTCDTCLEALEGVLTLILKCLKVEEKINKYIELEGKDDKGQVELKKVQEFMLSPTIKLESELFALNKLDGKCDQIQKEYTMMVETEIKGEKQISNTELIIKTEDENISSEQSVCDAIDTKSELSDCDGFQELFKKIKAPNEPLHISDVVKSETKKSTDLLTCTNPSKVETFKCKLCAYEAKRKDTLMVHLLTHKNPSEIRMFKCEMCPYEAKRKTYLKQHLLTHKTTSEIKMFKCEFCSYEAKQKRHLARHLLTHKSPLEIKIFKCEMCLHEAKSKIQLRQHLLKHEGPFGMIKCEFCSYQTEHKSYLTSHLLTHKTPSEIKMFQCEFCSYQTKWKSALPIHLLTHKSLSEIKMFKCELCSYETKRKSHIQTHLLTHRSTTEIMVFKCAICSYQAKHKGNLVTHLLTHTSPSEINMFKCALCSYEAKEKCHLETHLWTHKSYLEIKMFKCESCSFETTRKSSLTRHSFAHKSP